MLKLQQFHLQLATRQFTPQTRKHLRISIGNILRCTIQPGKFLNEQSLQWPQSLTFPVLYNKQFNFQIFDVHEFGYNERQLAVMEGKIVIDSVGDSRGTWEVWETATGKKCGYLGCEIVSKVPAMVRSIIGLGTTANTGANVSKIGGNTNPQENSNNNAMGLPQQVQQKPQRKLRISSIVSRTPSLILKRAYISIEIAGDNIKTSQLRSRAGQLVSIEPKSIVLPEGTNDKLEAKVRVVAVKGDGLEEIVAEGVMGLDGGKLQKKVILKKDSTQVGQVYIQSKIIQKTQINNSSYISTTTKSPHLHFPSSTADILQSSHLIPRTKSISPSHSNEKQKLQLDYTKLEHFGINSSRVMNLSKLDSSMISTTSARKKNSVLAQNNNIVFPKERRFMIYQDRQNERVTYLNERSFQYRTEKTGGRYRGASIGYGDKTDFTRAKRENPGVGNYRLPSIWDRY